MIRTFLFALLLPLTAAADPISLHRGLNLDLWMGWGYEDPNAPADWRDRVPPDLLSQLKTDGFDFIRMVVDPFPLLEMGAGVGQMAQLDQIAGTVTLLQNAGFTVLVDLHGFPREDGWGIDDIIGNPAVAARHLALTGALAARLNGFDPALTAIEVLNEPTLDCLTDEDLGAGTWAKQMLALHAAARTAAPDLPIVLSGSCWGGIDGLERIDPETMQDDNVIWSFHSYDPFVFTHQTATWVDAPIRYFADLPYPPSVMTDQDALRLTAEAALRAQTDPDRVGGPVDVSDYSWTMDDYRQNGAERIADAATRAAAWADAHGIDHARLVMGEFGSQSESPAGGTFDTDSRMRFLEGKRSAAEAQGIGWAVWSFSGAMRVTTDDTSRQMDPGICDALGLLGC